MDSKIMKYVCIASCGAVAIFLLVLQLDCGGFDNGRFNPEFLLKYPGN
jgi:hypothetical protein